MQIVLAVNRARFASVQVAAVTDEGDEVYH